MVLFYVSAGGAIRFPWRKRTFLLRETYVFHMGNVNYIS